MTALLLAWMLMALLGLGLWVGVGRWPTGAGAVPAALGHGLVLGLVACGATLWLPSLLGSTTLSGSAWAWPAVPALLGAALAWWRRRSAPAPRGIDAGAPCPWWLLAVVAVLVGVRALWLFDEAWLRPLFAWDGWVAWSAKARAWVLSQQAADFVPAGEWLAAGGQGVRTSLAAHYPELPSWIQVWLASAGGGWHDGAINLAWPLLWLALLAGCFGQWRALALPAAPAVVALYLLASLPLINVHAALPGYADLWLGTCLVFAALAWLRFRERGERGQLHLALLFAALLPLLKFEGAVWASGLLALMLWFALERYGRGWRLAAAAGVVALALAASWLLGLAWLQLLAGLLAGLGDQQFWSVLAAMATGLFAQDNWHLLWYLLPAILAWRWRALRAMPELAGLALALAAGLVLVLLLFTLSEAGRWAESFTAVNRLVLQLAPLAVTVMALALRAGRSGAPAAAHVGSPGAARVPRDPAAGVPPHVAAGRAAAVGTG
jgi:hypothetical protein